MKHRGTTGLSLAALLAVAAPVHAQSIDLAPAKSRIDALLDKQMSSLLAIYRDLHSHPELAMQEVRTAEVLASNLQKLGFEVNRKVGVTGVVGVLRNGAGPTVMIRTELDALPMEEKTGLPFASKVKVGDSFVDHACGHDVHITWTIATAQALVALKDQWHGTVVLIGQPAEEALGGAKAMLADGLLTRFPKPDFGFAAHVSNLPAGAVLIKDGAMSAASDSYTITFQGRGAHGSMPSASIDPIVIGAHFVTDVQSVISREREAGTFGVVTVGAFQSGTVPNIIPDTAQLKVNLRSHDEATRGLLKDGVQRTAKAVAAMARAPEPAMTYLGGTGAVVNDSAMAKGASALLRPLLGPGVQYIPTNAAPGSASEDYSEFIAAGVPSLFFGIGGYDPKAIADYKAKGLPVPVNHSPLFAPDAEPAIRAATSAIVLSIIGGVKP